MDEKVTITRESVGQADTPLDQDSFPCGWVRVAAVCMSDAASAVTRTVPSITLRVGSGIAGAAAAAGHRQVALLASESAGRVREDDLAENILTTGIDLTALPVGAALAVGTALLVVTQVGVDLQVGEACQQADAASRSPEGIYCVVVRDGSVRRGDPVVRVAQDTLGGALS